MTDVVEIDDPAERSRIAEAVLRDLCDPRPLGGVCDLDDLCHGSPVTRMPAWPL